MFFWNRVGWGNCFPRPLTPPGVRFRTTAVLYADILRFFYSSSTRLYNPCQPPVRATTDSAGQNNLPGQDTPTFPLIPAASTYRPSVQVLGFEEHGLLTRAVCLLCGFCSSAQRFAFGFLQTPPRGGSPCRLASSSPCRACKGLSPPTRCALPGTPKQNGPAAQARSPVALRTWFT